MLQKDRVRQQFGAHAADYITNQPLAAGASLVRLVELLQPERDWTMLDVATGAGHTAFTFAPRVDQVRATDITREMLAAAQAGAWERGLNNITFDQADAEALPYPAGRFDLVTCRIAAHHFGRVGPFLAEAARVLRPGGLLAITDLIVPPGPAGDYINALEKFRDPSHARCLTADEWGTAIAAAGLALEHEETLDMPLDFDFWVKRHDPLMQGYIRALVFSAPPEAAAHLQPQTLDEVTTFCLKEGLFIGRIR